MGSGRDLIEELVSGCDPVALEGLGPLVSFPGCLPRTQSTSVVSAAWGEVPRGAVVFEAEVDQPFEIDDGDAGGERDAVAVDAAVSAASVAVGDEPRNGAFDHRSVPAVGGLEAGVGGAGPMGPLDRVLGM